MSNIELAVSRIKILECPTGQLENRIASILQDYQVANIDAIRVSREEHRDRDGLEAYGAEISGNNQNHITVLAKSGLDDYMATVVDAHID
jgi:hypothetical protein